MPGICAASRSISSIASPELTPGAAWPGISNEGQPRKRDEAGRRRLQRGLREGREGHHRALVVADVPLVDVRRLRRDRARRPGRRRA